MSKKRFSEGLDELLQPSGGDTSTAPLPPAEDLAGGRRSGASKNFTRDLEALFEAALNEDDDTVEGEAHTPVTSVQTPAAPTRNRGAGLDALIRPTEMPSDDTAYANAALKRLTVTVERTKVEKLRSLARLENLYLKDVLQRAIDEYLKKYEADTGAAY